MRVIQATEPTYDRSRPTHEASPLAARWVAHPRAPSGPAAEDVFVADYSISFVVGSERVVRVRVSADERYVLQLDGQQIGRGPERGDRDHWHFETYDLPLSAGTHQLVARVHSLGKNRPYAQASVRHAFLLMAEGEWSAVLSTGLAPWMAASVDGYAPINVALPKAFMAVGARVRIDGARAATAQPTMPVTDIGAVVLTSMRMESPGQWQLTAASLPAMLEQPVTAGQLRRLQGSDNREGWAAFLRGGELVIPPHASVQAIVDLDEYFCVYPKLVVSGGKGAVVSIAFAEALFEADGFTKQQRDRVDGLQFVGMGDELICPGTPFMFEPLWWLAGRYVQITVTTKDALLQLQQFQLIETRYPVTWDSKLVTADETISRLMPITRRAMEMCSHETYFDCPYYEQLMYVGDTRLEALVTYTHSRDDRLPRKAVRLFDQSRTPDGWTQARYPTKTTQVIPPFSGWWVAMVHDLAMWRDCPADVASHMPGVRAVMEAIYANVGDDGLFYPGTGWYFVDWAGWPHGVPDGGAERPVAPIHFQFAYIAQLAAELEDIANEPLLAQRHRQRCAEMVRAGRAAFYDAGRQLFFDDLSHTAASEHSQAMAVLSGAVTTPQERAAIEAALTRPGGLRPATIYYSHYVIEALRLLSRAEAVFDRLSLWSKLAEQGFKTTFEQPEPTRSDCHAWGAHPMFHFFATVLGIRPAKAGFASVRIQPQLGPLSELSGRMVHPRGMIEVSVKRVGQRLEVNATLPPGVEGVVIANGETLTIATH